MASISWLLLCGTWPSAFKRIGLKRTAAPEAAWKVEAVSTRVARQDTRRLVVTKLVLDPVSWGLVCRLLARQQGCFCGESLLAGASITPALRASPYLDVTFWSKNNDHDGSIGWRQIIFWLSLHSPHTQKFILYQTPTTHKSKSGKSSNLFITRWCTFASL